MDHPLLDLINARIAEAEKDGAFDNLEGAGRPLPPCDDPENALVNRLIRENGPLNEFLLALGIIDSPLEIINTDIAVQLGLFYSYLPFMVLPIYAAVERYNFALSEAGADLYAGRWTIMREIVLPVVKPGIIAGCILVFVPSLGAFLAPDLLGGAKNFMIGSLIEEQFKGQAGNWPFGAASSMILLSMVLVVLFFYARGQAREQV